MQPAEREAASVLQAKSGFKKGVKEQEKKMGWG